MNETAYNKWTIAHPNPRGTGSALRLCLFPADETAQGHVSATFGKQTTCGEVYAGGWNPPEFDWLDAVTVKLRSEELAEILRVLRGEQESIADGKGIFHRTAKANAVIKFSHVIEPCPGYLFSVSQKPLDGDLSEAFIVLRPNEALMLSCVIEHIFASIIFGV